MMRWYALPLGLALLGSTCVGRADYLQVRREVWLKKSPEPDGAPIEKLPSGTLVTLARDRQSNGYYFTKTQDGRAGYVYRTFVRRHPGAPPPEVGKNSQLDAIEQNSRDSQSELPVHPAEKLDSHLPRMWAHFIDVGQGAATLFEFSCGAVLVDTGGELDGEFNSTDVLRAYLQSFFERRHDLKKALDLVVLTHPHIDHTRNVKLLLEDGLSVKHLLTDALDHGSGIEQQTWLRRQLSDRTEAIVTESIPRGGRTDSTIDPIRCSDEDPKLQVLWGSLDQQPPGWNKGDFRNENNHSIALRIDFGSASFLVSGDLEEKAIGAMLAKHGGTRVLDVDVWEVNHHGSQNGTTSALVDALTPSIVVFAAGSEQRHVNWSAWQYGHPRKDVVDLLTERVSRARPTKVVKVAEGQWMFEDEQLKKAAYSTGWDGTVVITATNDGNYEIETER